MARPTILRGAAGITLAVAVAFLSLRSAPPTTAGPLQARDVSALDFQLEGYFGGSYSGVVVSGTVAYASRGRVLEVLDVSAPTAPRLLGTSPVLPAGARVKAAGPDLAYVMARIRGDGDGDGEVFDRLHIMDVRDATAPALAGTLLLPASKHTDVVARGTWLHAAAGDAGITIVDASDPATPRVAAQVDLGLEVTGLAWQEDHLLVAATDEQDIGWLWVMDGRDPLDPQLVGRVEVGGPTGKVFGSGSLALMSSLQRADGFYTGGMPIVDLADPMRPRVTEQLPTPIMDVMGFAQTSGRLYTLEPPHGVRGPYYVRSFDRDHLTEGGYLHATFTWGAAIAATGDELLFAGGPAGLLTLRTDLEQEGGAIVEQHVRPVLGAPQGVALADDRAYLTDVDNELWVLDVSEPAAAVAVGRTKLEHSLEYALGDPRGGPIRLRDGIAYVSRLPYGFQYGGLHVFDIEDPVLPTQLGLWDPYIQHEVDPTYDPRGGITGIHPPLLFGDRLWLSGNRTLIELDVSEPAAPRFVQELSRPNGYSSSGGFGAGGAATDGERLYLAAYEDGVYALDVSTPGQSTIVDRAAMPGYVADVALKDGVVLAVGAGTGLRVLEADTLSAVRSVEDARGGAIVVEGDTAYVTTHEGVVAFDVGDARNPLRRGQHETPMDIDYTHLAVDGDLLAIARWFGGDGVELVRASQGEPLQEPTPGPTLTPWPSRTPGSPPPQITPLPSSTPDGATAPASTASPASTRSPATSTVFAPRSTPDPLYLPLTLKRLDSALATRVPTPRPPVEPQASATPSPIETPSAAAETLSLGLRADRIELPFGDVAAYTGTFTNGSDDPVVIIEPVDGSTWGWRMPSYLWVVERTDGQPVRRRQQARCGNVNPLLREDFRTLEPGASWTLRPDEPWMMPPDWFWSFTEPGEYQVQLRYVLDKSLEDYVSSNVEDLWALAFDGEVPSAPVFLQVAPPTDATYAERLARRKEVPLGASRAETEAVMGEPDQVASGSQGETHLAYYLVDLPPGDPQDLPYPRSEHIATPRVVVTLGEAGGVSEVVLLP